MVTLDAEPDPNHGLVGRMIGVLVVLALTCRWFDEGKLERTYTQIKSYIEQLYAAIQRQ